jgi:putative transferase (TIGR04331 family)
VVLEEISGVTLTATQSDRLVGFWLLHLVHQIVGLDNSARAIHLAGEHSLRLQIPHSQREHMTLSYKSADYRDRYLNLIHELGSRHLRVDTLSLERIPVKSRGVLRNAKDILARVTSERSPGQRQAIWIIDPYLKLTYSEFLKARRRTSRLVSWIPAHYSPKSVTSDIAWSKRLELSRSIEITDAESLAKALVPLLIPYGYAEDLADSFRELSRHTPAPPRVLYTANGLQSSFTFQLAASLWGESGTLVCAHQHGGHTGLDKRHALEDLEVELSHRYYTFGWTDDRSGIEALPIPQPENGLKVEPTRILLMSLESSPFTYRLQPFCVAHHVDLCLKETRAFLDNSTQKESIVVRCRGAEAETLGLATMGIEVEALHGFGAKSIAISALVVHNYLGTSWLESLAMNVPTVCFIPPGIHAFRSAAQPFVDRLQQVGILHYSGRDAARFVNSFKGDLNTWWKSAEVQEAREAFVARYANFSDDWLAAWQAEFESLLAE